MRTQIQIILGCLQLPILKQAAAAIFRLLQTESIISAPVAVTFPHFHAYTDSTLFCLPYSLFDGHADLLCIQKSISTRAELSSASTLDRRSETQRSRPPASTSISFLFPSLSHLFKTISIATSAQLPLPLKGLTRSTMFRRLPSGLPQDPVFPTTLQGLG